jgi:PIN domain nuclease of toxin-antitoxin system
VILLDTQVVYWSVTGTGRLGPQTRELIGSAPQRFVSAITHVEFAIKATKGKLHVPPGLPDLLDGMGLTGLGFTEDHAQELGSFPTLAGHDPFNRMLLAQARHEGLVLVTTDRLLLTFDHTVDATR